MVKTTGPMLSAAASGTLADAITHSNWKGRSYAKRPGKPTNNQQPTQLGLRAAMTFLAKEWKTLTSVAQASWGPLSTPFNIPAYNAYISENLTRIVDNASPYKEYPRVPDSYPVTVINFADESFFRYVAISFEITHNMNQWNVQIHRSPVAIFDPLPSNLVAMITPKPIHTAATYNDKPPSKGTWYYKLFAASKDGDRGSATGTQTVVWA